jgi:hypothetical protein
LDRHVTGAIQDANEHWPLSSFDTIVLSGVFGFGLDSVKDQNTALRVCRHLLESDGRLILGWNTDRCGDPSELSALREHYLPSSIPGLARRQTFAKSTHVYETFSVVPRVRTIVPSRTRSRIQRNRRVSTGHPAR